jgi:GTP-binding protein
MEVPIGGFIPVARRSPAVVLVGRPNVGKSTLFNRIAGSRRSIVAPMPGTTRDVITQAAEWQGHTFQLTDTGGMFGASADPLHDLVVDKGRMAIAGAELVVFVVDAVEGRVPADDEVAAAIRSAGKRVVLAINKADDRRARAGALDFYQLGFDAIVEVSAEHGLGVGDLLDLIVEGLGRKRTGDQVLDPSGTDVASDTGDDLAPAAVSDQGPSRPPAEVAVAIVGRPNVGKSSLVNRLLREERLLVSDLPGTTRDAVDVVLTWHRRHFRIVDTAGIRRPGRVASGGSVEAVSVLQARRAIARADVVVLVIDAVEGPTDQDAAIAGEADKGGRGLIVAVNKWDLMKGRGQDFPAEFDEEVRRKMKFLDYAPLLHISALTGERLPRLLEAVERVGAARLKRVGTSELNRFVEAITAANPPVSRTRHEVRVMYATQSSVAPPRFVFFTNVATTFHFSYERFLMNRLRAAFGFEGTPVRIEVRAKAKRQRK